MTFAALDSQPHPNTLVSLSNSAGHVKGQGSKKGESLRVHFFADYRLRKIVIAHCGEHLPTYDTPTL